MEQFTSSRQNPFYKFMDFLFKDYPAWLWDKPNIFKIILFPFFFIFKIFEVLVSARGAQKYRYMRVWFASTLSVVLGILLYNAGFFGSSAVQQTASSLESVNDTARTSSIEIASQKSYSSQDMTNYYIITLLVGVLVVLIWISVFTKTKTTNFQKSEVIVGQNKKSGYNKN